MNKINLNSAAFLVLGVFLLLTPALSQAIITSLVTAFFRDIDLLLWVNLAQNFWILNLIPKVVGATLVAGFAWKHLKTRFKVDLPKIKVQTTRLATYSLLFMLCAGLFLFADVPVSEAATTATTGYILDTPVSEHAWLIGAYSDGTYYAIEGSTWDNKVAGVGSTAWASYKTNSTKITDLVLDSTTSGSIYMKDVAFDMNLFDDIPEGVRVICSYNAEYWEYINSADSSGSPYTVSVGSGVNVGYYLAQDGEGRICYSSTNVYTLFTSLIAVTPSHIKVCAGTYPVDTQIWLNSNLLLEADKDVKFTTTISELLNSVFYVFGKQNVTLRGLNIEGGTTQKNSGVIGLGFSKSAHITVDNCIITGFQYGIFTNDYSVWRIDDLVVSNCVFTDLRFNALNLLDVNNSKIINNYIFNTGQSGIVGYLSNSVIDGNTIVNSGQLEQYYGGITIINPREESEFMQNLVISNNAVHFTTEPPYIVNGIVISAENEVSSYVDGVTITGNTILCYTNHTNFNAGIYLHTKQTLPALINIRNVVLTGNTVTNMRFGAILMGDCITFSGNNIYNATVGVWNYGASISQGVSTFNVNGNVIKGIDTLEHYDGVRVTGTGARSIIASNFIEYFSMGINEEFHISYYVDGDYSFITSNYIQNCTTPINVVGENTNSTNNFTP